MLDHTGDFFYDRTILKKEKKEEPPALEKQWFFLTPVKFILLVPYHTMIRLFLKLCKTFHEIKNKNELQIYELLAKPVADPSEVCPTCGAPASSFHKDGSYERDFIFLNKGIPSYHKIKVYCVECNSCGHAHALEPAMIVPYSSFRFGFLVTLLYDKITKRFPTLLNLCEYYGISVTTFYRIYKRFLVDGFSLSALTDSGSMILELFSLPSVQLYTILQRFFRFCGYSFLQPRIKFRQNLSLQNLPLVLADTLKMVTKSILC